MLSDRCSLRVESAANPLRCCLSWRRACEVRRGGPAGRVRGHRMTGGTPKEVHWTAEQQKRPQRTYRGRKRRETAAKGSTTGRVSGQLFRAQNVVFVNPPKDSPEGSRRSRFDQNSTRRDCCPSAPAATPPDQQRSTPLRATNSTTETARDPNWVDAYARRQNRMGYPDALGSHIPDRTHPIPGRTDIRRNE